MKLNSIQFLRAIAALLVVYEHSMDYQAKFSISKEQSFLHLYHFGCIGVDLFFVISGFVITYVANNYYGAPQSFHFLAKRFCRINPVYYIATIFFLAVEMLRVKINNESIIASFQNLGSKAADSILILPTSHTVYSFSPLLVVGWTLAFEWLFYILFFFLILLKVKMKGLFLLSTIGSLVFIGRLSHFEDLTLVFFTNPIMLEFSLGVVICYCYIHIKHIPVFIGASFLSLGLICYLLLVFFGFGYIWHYQLILSGDLSLNRFLYWGIPSSLIVAGSVILEKNGRLNLLWSNKISLLMGDASYSIYLVHIIILQLLMILYFKIGTFLPPDAIIWVQMVVVVSSSIFFYKLVEEPLLQYMQRNSIWDTFFPKKQRTATESGTATKQASPTIQQVQV